MSSICDRPPGSSLRGENPDEVVAALDDKTEAAIGPSNLCLEHRTGYYEVGSALQRGGADGGQQA